MSPSHPPLTAPNQALRGCHGLPRMGHMTVAAHNFDKIFQRLVTRAVVLFFSHRQRTELTYPTAEVVDALAVSVRKLVHFTITVVVMSTSYTVTMSRAAWVTRPPLHDRSSRHEASR